jgi:hypothetical protein
MEKIYNTSEGRNGPVFIKESKEEMKVVLEGDLEKSMRESFSGENNKRIYSEKGVLVHMTEKEYKFFQDIQDGEYRTISIEEYNDLYRRF